MKGVVAAVFLTVDQLWTKQLYGKSVKNCFPWSILPITYYLVESAYHQEKEGILLQFKLNSSKNKKKHEQNKEKQKKNTKKV